MANRERGEMTLVMGGVSYTIHLTIAACCALEDASGRSWKWHLDQWVETEHIKPFVWLVWAALQARHGDTFPTFESVANALERADEDGIDAVMRAFAVHQHDVRERLIRAGLLPRPNPPTAQAATTTTAAPGSVSTSKLAPTA